MGGRVPYHVRCSLSKRFRMSPPITSNPLFFLDYDGTLAPIVDDPMQAFPHPAITDILDDLADRYPVWVVTGRYLGDLEQLIDHTFEAIGLHGIQRGRLQGPKEYHISDNDRGSIRKLRETAPVSADVQLEEKGPMFALHYRRASDKDAAREAIRQWLSDKPDSLDAIWGKDVVELRPKGISKGTAVSEIAERFSDRTPIYLGDDVTDEDAFRALGDEALTVKVGDGETDAKYRLGGVEEVAEYLRRYLG